ncbi:uncharacterized protein C4orf54 homolog [Kryptolebias marmoratus]|uniref:Chromosome 4 open reading frame 54 n=1 Tax=Kryptolebias marmoratus TaxID=37003 RepID=A0A3Q2ZTK2_KRYMA|nr:uncharacterized protein C4orf54 homolog [Kryptolebias marmoratus]
MSGSPGCHQSASAERSSTRGSIFCAGHLCPQVTLERHGERAEVRGGGGGARTGDGSLLQIIAAGRRIPEKRDETKSAEPRKSAAEPERGGEADRAWGRGGAPNSHLPEMRARRKEDTGGEERGEDVKEAAAEPSSSSPSSRCVKKTDTSLQLGGQSARVMTHPDTTEETENTRHEEEAPRGGDYLSERSESDDGEEVDDESLVLFYESGPCVTEDESHYITTHGIQLSELSDHEGDFGVGSSAGSWDIEDDSQVYPFVDYCFEGERGCARLRAQGAAAVSTLPESDPRAAAKYASPEEQSGGNSGGQIHLSIRTTSRAINDPGSVQERENVPYHARRAGYMSRCVFRGVDGKAEALCDKCLIAAPGRLHFGGKLRGKELTEHSSGTSSAVSELDDADKEVRSLTAKAFRSLAQPYFDAFSFSTSSESSASELNRWSAFVDLKYGNMNVDQSAVARQNPDSKGHKGVALASIKPPSSQIFALSGTPRAQQIQLMGQFGQGRGGVIRLTETLNFRCNVKSAGERRAQFAQNAAGSRSADEVTGGAQSGASEAPLKAMEGTHKKAVFASSLIKNVISKKMQFEQERRMERGEIREPQQEGDRWKGDRRASRISESSSDYNIMCVDELGDIVDSGSCDSRRRDRSAPAPQTDLEAASGAGIDTKKGALEASRSTLLRSQNSAFRCWKDEELGFQKEHGSRQTLQDTLDDNDGEADQPSGRGKLTKMSHLFVPSIQLLPGDAEARQQLQSGSGLQVRSDNTLYITDSSCVTTSKSPEIKINLRSVKDNKTEPPGVSKLRAPPNTASSLIKTDDLKCQTLAAALKGEPADKVPHFMVRDIRDNKGKLQTPIHQVRDMRKLVKSSYHFVSLDNNENKSGLASADNHSEQKKLMHNRNPNSVSPIVIKCQSVNTNKTGKQPGNLELVKQESCDTDKSEEAKSAPPQGAEGAALSFEGELRVDNRVASDKQDTESEVIEKKPEPKIANQMAFEKLQAAVKTMEQLYVFDKNEWRRKIEPQPLTDSHVLSLIANEEQGGPEEGAARGPNMDRTVRRDSYPNIDKTPPALATSPGTDCVLRREDKDLKVPQTSSSRDERLGVRSAQGLSAAGTKSKSNKASTAAKVSHPNAAAQAPFGNKGFAPKSPKLPVSLKISQTGISRNKGAERRDVGRFEHQFSSTPADNENYLAIPVKSHLSSKPVPAADRASANTFAAQSHPTSPPRHEGPESRSVEDPYPEIKRSSIVMETHPQEVPPATIYHSLPLGISASQPQVYCFSPAVTPAPALDPFQATQRKMLLDPTTGNYYLVDTPVQPATRRLFDPETGHYVEVPMPQPPMTPVPMPISPLALSPGAYGHAYMIYPSFVPTPSVIPARTLVQSQLSVPSEAECGEKASSQQTEGMYMETPFYMATGKAPQAASVALQQTACRPQHSFSSFKQPVISITSQQGPRIIAPPSFDGTTMSFVVEHR